MSLGFEEANNDFRRSRVYVDEGKEGEGFNKEEAFPVLAIRDGQGGVTEFLVSDMKKELVWVKMENTKLLGLSRV